jgi:hypothetical protein
MTVLWMALSTWFVPMVALSMVVALGLSMDIHRDAVVANHALRPLPRDLVEQRSLVII